MKNVELKRKGAYSMILRTDGKEHKSLYVVKNFDPTKEDGNQWDCSEFYGTTSCGGTLAFGAADRAVENERLKMDPDQEVIPGLYAVEFTPTSTEMFVQATSAKEALENAQKANALIDPMDPVPYIEVDDSYIIEPLTFDAMANMISRRATDHWGNTDSSIIFNE